MTTRNKTGPTPKQDKSLLPYSRRDKRLNKPAFNRMAKKRRLKEKHDAKNRKKNMLRRRMSRR